MKILVDTHAMLWWLRDDSRLSEQARRLFQDGRTNLLWSMVSSWELAVKVSIGKLYLDRPVHRLFADLVSEQGVEVVPITHEHCTLVAKLPLHHRDPFDRMLVAQAQSASVPLLTADRKLAAYDVATIW